MKTGYQPFAGTMLTNGLLNLPDCQGMQGSMSGKGICWNNALRERFFLNLKMERVWRHDYANHEKIIDDATDAFFWFSSWLSSNQRL